ncbi:MAG: deoxynucleoside kinase, partial [Chloroflexi bacterium]|nr:deoxynucleoside kinase [Chloroflexota bacterium]
VVRSLPAPSLLVYLKAPVPILMERIQRRARNMETGISQDYLSLLESYYDDWLTNFDLCPVLTIRTDDLDFVNQPKHLDIVADRIQEKLSGKEEIIFPKAGD